MHDEPVMSAGQEMVAEGTVSDVTERLNDLVCLLRGCANHGKGNFCPVARHEAIVRTNKAAHRNDFGHNQMRPEPPRCFERERSWALLYNLVRQAAKESGRQARNVMRERMDEKVGNLMNDLAIKKEHLEASQATVVSVATWMKRNRKRLNVSVRASLSRILGLKA